MLAQQQRTGASVTEEVHVAGGTGTALANKLADAENDASTEAPKIAMSQRVSVLLTVWSIILTVIALFFGVRYLLNLRFTDAYANGTYNASIPHTLTYLNFPDSYLPYYNFGCATFMMGNYDYAAGAFTEALEHNPPHDDPYPSRECQVRINLALALTRPLRLDSWGSDKERQRLIQVLTTARGYLTEDGCANPEKDVFDGHSEDAEQLKRDIDKALEKLNDPQGGSDDDSSDQDDQQGSGDNESDSQGDQGSQSEERLKERLNDRKSDAMQERTRNQETWENLQNIGNSGSSGGDLSGGGGGSSGSSSGRNW